MGTPTEYSADLNWSGSVVVPSPEAIVASGGIPVKPPKEWFSNPQFKGVHPLTVTPDGRVSGHIAAWESSHIGMLGKVQPPRSKSNYAYFRTGQLETAEGDLLPVGQITLSGGHAPLRANAVEAVQHYDDTNSAVMDVAAGEDEYGIWVAGALRPDVDDLKLRKIRASGVSGDWRPVKGSLELVAVCAVNVPGFPIPRALAASAVNESTPHSEIRLLALVAAGTETLSRMSLSDAALTAAVEAVEDIETKLEWVKDVLSALTPDAMLESADSVDEMETAPLPENPEASDEPAVDLEGEGEGEGEGEVEGESQESQAEVEVEAAPEAEAEVEVEPEAVADEGAAGEAPEVDLIAEAVIEGSLDRDVLADVVYQSLEEDTAWSGDSLPMLLSLAQCESIALRMRFRNSATVLSIEERAEAVRSGAAMPDGRLPIRTAEDVEAARKCVPAGASGDEMRAHINRRAKALGVN